MSKPEGHSPKWQSLLVRSRCVLLAFVVVISICRFVHLGLLLCIASFQGVHHSRLFVIAFWIAVVLSITKIQGPAACELERRCKGMKKIMGDLYMFGRSCGCMLGLLVHLGLLLSPWEVFAR